MKPHERFLIPTEAGGWYQNVGSMFFRFFTKHTCDGQMDGQTELRSQDRASIAASRGKKQSSEFFSVVFKVTCFLRESNNCFFLGLCESLT